MKVNQSGGFDGDAVACGLRHQRGVNMDFVEFPKMARLSREVIVTEKIDGTNAAVVIADGLEGVLAPNAICKVRNLDIYAQSRTRFITPQDDNFGFARWVADHAEELADRETGLGTGRHFGEWWGQGIQRNYGMPHKVFSLFNVTRWENSGPECCRMVPVLYRGPFETDRVIEALDDLRINGSRAAPGFMKPEGIVVFHTAANIGFKKTIEKDDVPKSLHAANSRSLATAS